VRAAGMQVILPAQVASDAGATTACNPIATTVVTVV
jgi:hypothetical protein